MKCTSCLHQFIVKAEPATSQDIPKLETPVETAKSSEIALSSLEEVTSAPVAKAREPAKPASAPSEGIALASFDGDSVSAPTPAAPMPAPAPTSAAAPAADAIALAPLPATGTSIPLAPPPPTAAPVAPQKAAAPPTSAPSKLPPRSIELGPPSAVAPPSTTPLPTADTSKKTVFGVGASSIPLPPPPVPAAAPSKQTIMGFSGSVANAPLPPPSATMPLPPPADVKKTSLGAGPKSPLLANLEDAELPGPRSPTPVSTVPPASVRGGGAMDDLPAPVRQPSFTPVATPKSAAPSAFGIGLDDPEEEEELLPPGPKADLPAPRAAGFTDVPAPKADLPAARYDLPLPKPGLPAPLSAVAVDDDSLLETLSDDDIAEVDPVEGGDAPATAKPAPSASATSEAPAAAATPLPTKKTKGKATAAAPTTPIGFFSSEPVATEKNLLARWREVIEKRRISPLMLIVGAVVLFSTSIGIGLWVRSMVKHHSQAKNELRLAVVRNGIADDTLNSFKRAQADTIKLLEKEPERADLLALKAQTALLMVRIGIDAEKKTADPILSKVEEEENLPAEFLRARGLRDVAAARWTDARTKLTELVGKTPADASAWTYLGWAEYGTGDLLAAEKAFTKALSVEPKRTAALFTMGLIKEQQQQLLAAQSFYKRAIARSPKHIGARVALARVNATKERAHANESLTTIEEIIANEAASAAPKELADAWASAGLLLAQTGRLPEAEERVRKAVALDGKTTSIQVALAWIQCERGHGKEATSALQKIVNAEPKNLAARLVFLRALVESGSAAEVGPIMAPAISQAPRDTRVLYWQGRVAQSVGGASLAKALDFYKEVLKIDPKYIPAYLGQSAVFGQLGKNDDALNALKEAEAQASDDPDLTTELAQSYLQLGRAADAEARFRAALEKRPDLHWARIQLGEALLQQKRPEDAKAEYAEVEKRAPNYTGLAEKQGLLAIANGQKELAWEYFSKALKQESPSLPLRTIAAPLGFQLGHVDEAKALSEGILKENERSAPAHWTLARIHIYNQHFDRALAEAKRAANLSDVPEAHLVLADALNANEKYDQALVEYERARKPPFEDEAQLGHARLLVRMGSSKDALKELEPLAKNPALRERVVLLLGDCYAEFGQRDKARKFYEEAVAADPKSGEAAFKYGRALYDSGKRKPAIEFLERSLAVTENPTYQLEALLLLGDVCRETKQPVKALSAYKKYLEVAPKNASTIPEVEKHVRELGGDTENP